MEIQKLDPEHTRKQLLLRKKLGGSLYNFENNYYSYIFDYWIADLAMCLEDFQIVENTITVFHANLRLIYKDITKIEAEEFVDIHIRPLIKNEKKI